MERESRTMSTHIMIICRITKREEERQWKNMWLQSLPLAWQWQS